MNTNTDLRGVVLLSGGLDSTTLLYWLSRRSKHRRQFCIGFNYGQKHCKELLYARLTATDLNVPFRVVDLTGMDDLLKSTLSRKGGEVPDAPYDEETQKLTMVPNRNAIMLSIAAGWAYSLGLHRVYYAAHRNDAAGYPDCSWQFVQALNLTTKLALDDPHFEIRAPFVHKTKAELVKVGQSLKVPFDRTWSCYKGGDIACGVCGTCRERIEAFQVNDLIDPLPYAISIGWRRRTR